jgi:type VI secretion system secreted protein VgrG
LWDHSSELPHKHLESDKTIQDSVPWGRYAQAQGGNNEKLGLYDYPGNTHTVRRRETRGGDRTADIQKIFTDNARTWRFECSRSRVLDLDRAYQRVRTWSRDQS